MADGSIIIDTKLNISGAKADMRGLTSQIKDTQMQMDLLVDKFIESKRHIKNLSDKDLDRMVNNFKQSNAEYQGLVSKQKELTAGVKQYEKSLTGTTRASAKVTTNFNGIGKAITKGVKSIAKFSLALVGMVGLSGLISSSIREWGESGNKEAQQLQANIKQLKSAIGASLAPVINTVLNMFFKALAVVNALLKAFTGINFLAKATAKSTGQTAKNAKGTLASFDELNVLSTGGESGGDVSPSANLDELSTQFDDMANNIKETIETITAPLKIALEPLINFTGGNLKEFYDNVLVPIGEWAVNSALPTFFEFLASVINVFTSVLETLKPLATWLWNNFLEPAGKWLGEALIKGIKAVTEKLNEFSDWIKENQTTVENIAIVIGVVAGAFWLVNTAITVWNVIAGIATAVTTGFGIAMTILTSPITLIILAIALLVAGIILLIKNWDTVKEVALSVWEKIKEIWGNVANWFKEKIIEPIKNFFSGLWDGITTGVKNAFTAVKNVIVNAINFVIEKLNSFIAGFENGLNSIIRKINRIEITNPFTGEEIWSPSVPEVSFMRIPKLAKGGIAYQPTQAIIGEAGREAVLPLENNTEWMDDLAERLSLNQNVNIEFTGSLSQLARVLNPVIKKEQTRMGARLIGGAL